MSLQDPHKQIVGAVAGNLEKAHAACVEICRKRNLIDVHGCVADLIITSPGGAPRDIGSVAKSKSVVSSGDDLCTGETTFYSCCRSKEWNSTDVCRLDEKLLTLTGCD